MRDLGDVTGLRWRLDSDRCPIAVAQRKPYRNDHLYLHGPGVLGVYFEARTKLGTTKRVQVYRKMLRGKVIDVIRGELDGLILLRAEGEGDIPGMFFRGKRGWATRSRFLKRSTRCGDLEQNEEFSRSPD